jgi:hypothetical protein
MFMNQFSYLEFSKMGAHGVSPFDDDEASDFAAEIICAEDMNIIAQAVYAVPDADEQYVESGTATRALVAAEVLAAQMGNESGDVPDELQSWIQSQDDPDNVLLVRARSAVRRVLRNSELRELWQQSELFPDWRERIQSLMKRLG